MTTQRRFSQYPRLWGLLSGLTLRLLLAGGTVVRPFSIKVGAAYPVVVWGNGPTAPAGLQAVAVAGGRWHGLALKSDGTVVTWAVAGVTTMVNAPCLPA